MCGDIMLNHIKEFYVGYRLYESIFLSLIVGASVTIISIAIISQFSYYKTQIHLGNTIYLVIFLLTFLATVSIANALKPKMRLSLLERLLLILGLIFSFTVVLVIL